MNELTGRAKYHISKLVLELYITETGPLGLLIPANQVALLSWFHLPAQGSYHFKAFLLVYLSKCLFNVVITSAAFSGTSCTTLPVKMLHLRSFKIVSVSC